jgi:hypothetical protein
MSTSSNKIIGYLLLVVGLSIIFWSVFASYDIFTAKKEAPKVFSYSDEGIVNLEKEDIKTNNEITIDQSKLADPNYLKGLEAEQKAQVENMARNQISEQLKEMIPEEFTLKILNLSSWSMLVFILIFAGSKIAALGIKLIKE